MENMIDITEFNLIDVVKSVYDLSMPQGLGHLQFEERSLTDDEALEIINPCDCIPVMMDYVKGRSCKFNVYKRDGRLLIHDVWYDHSDSDLKELLKRIGKK